MGLGRFLQAGHGTAPGHEDGHRHGGAMDGGTIDRPHAYELFTTIAFAGRRRHAFSRLAALSAARPGDRVLDVGCGTGYLTRALAARIGPDGRATGLDPSAPMLDYARRRGPSACSYVIGEAQDLSFGDASFDVVVSSYAVHHIPARARRAAFAQMHRVLRPGGRLLVADFRPPSSRAGRRLTDLLTGPAMAGDGTAGTGVDALVDLITEAGFTIEAEGRVWPMTRYVTAVRT